MESYKCRETDLHDGGSVVGDDGLALVVHDELVHAARAQRRAHLRHTASGTLVNLNLSYNRTGVSGKTIFYEKN